MTMDSPDEQAGAGSECSTSTVIEFVPSSSRLLIVVEHDELMVGSGFNKGTLALARLRIEYRPSNKLYDWMSLRRFLEEFAAKARSLEDAATEIHAHIENTVDPSEFRVSLERIDGPDNVTYRVVAGR